MNLTIEQRVKTVLVDALFIEVTEINLEDTLMEDLGADELDAINIALFLEDEFNIEIPDETIEQLKTVKDIISCVERKLLYKGENNGKDKI